MEGLLRWLWSVLFFFLFDEQPLSPVHFFSFVFAVVGVKSPPGFVVLLNPNVAFGSDSTVSFAHLPANPAVAAVPRSLSCPANCHRGRPASHSQHQQ